MIVIFLGQIAAGTSVFDLCAFLLACLVVILVRIYGLAGKVRLKKHVCIDVSYMFFILFHCKIPEGQSKGTRRTYTSDSVKHFQECLVLQCTLSMQGLWGVLGLKFRKFRIDSDRWDRDFRMRCWEHPGPEKVANSQRGAAQKTNSGLSGQHDMH